MYKQYLYINNTTIAVCAVLGKHMYHIYCIKPVKW